MYKFKEPSMHDKTKDYPWYYEPISFNDRVIRDWFDFLTNL